MSPEERLHWIEATLRKAFNPVFLEVLDDSAKHVGHPGSRGGAGHYTILIKADGLQPLSRIEAHRTIYSVLDELIPDDIHALSIKILQGDYPGDK